MIQNLENINKTAEENISALGYNERNLKSDRGVERNLKSFAASCRLGQSVNVSVERFVTVGEAIAENSVDIRLQMYAACEEARSAGSTIERLCVTDEDYSLKEKSASKSMSSRAAMVRAARSLLGSVTRVLLLADSVIVKELLLVNEKGSNRLEPVSNFIEFAKAFSQFGVELVELTHITSGRQIDLKEERRMAQMAAARCVLQRSGQMLLISAKTCSRHPDSTSARENRDTVFCQMRRAMDLIHYVVKDAILDAAASLVTVPSSLHKLMRKNDNWEGANSLSSYIQRFLDQVELTKLTLVGSQARQELPIAMDFLLERIQDFTDSAYTCHEDRENILLLCDRVRLQLNHLLRTGVTHVPQGVLEAKDSPNSNEVMPAIDGTLKSILELRAQLQETALLQASEMLRLSEDTGKLVDSLRNAALTTDSERLDEVVESFAEHLEHSQEVCRLLRHVCPTDALNIQAKYTEINLKIYGPQVAVAAQTLCLNPTSQLARDSLDLFVSMWQSLMDDLHNSVSEIATACRRQRPENQFYTSLPRPGKHGTTQKQVKPVKLDEEEQAKIAKSGLEMKMITSDLEAEAEKWGDETTSDEDNDIVRRAKIMSNMAYNMYQFTRGEGPLKTTQDLFTQAEYFAEEANRLYKVIRQFSYMVPTGTEKLGLLEKVDEVPTRVQQLQFKVKNPTVGKAATFTKVDSVIQETKDLMGIISAVVTTCFECASKYKLDFRGLTPRGRNSPYRSDNDDVSGAGGSSESKGASGSTSDGSM